MAQGVEIARLQGRLQMIAEIIEGDGLQAGPLEDEFVRLVQDRSPMG